MDCNWLAAFQKTAPAAGPSEVSIHIRRYLIAAAQLQGGLLHLANYCGSAESVSMQTVGLLGGTQWLQAVRRTLAACLARKRQPMRAWPFRLFWRERESH